MTVPMGLWTLQSIMLLLLLLWINLVPILVCFDSKVSLKEHSIMGFSRGTCAGKRTAQHIFRVCSPNSPCKKSTSSRGVNYNNLNYVTMYTANSSPDTTDPIPVTTMERPSSRELTDSESSSNSANLIPTAHPRKLHAKALVVCQ